MNLRGGEKLEEALGRIMSSDLLSSGTVGSEVVFFLVENEVDSRVHGF